MGDIPRRGLAQRPAARRAFVSGNGRLRAAAGGAIAAAVSIAVSELVAGLIQGAPSLVVAIGTLVIDLQPAGAKDVVVGLFGTNDKLALNVGVVLAALLIAAALGVVGRHRPRRTVGGFIAFGIVALVAAWREPLVSFPLAVVTAIVAVGAGLGVLRYLGVTASRLADDEPAGSATMPDWERRSFLRRSATVAGLAIAGGCVGR